MKKIATTSRVGIFAIFTLMATLGTMQAQSHVALAAQGCSLNSFYGTVAYNGTPADGAGVSLTDITEGGPMLKTTTTNGGLYLIETANLNTCASAGSQILLSASFNGLSTSTVIQYATQASTLVNLSILSATTTIPPSTTTSPPTTTPPTIITPTPTTTPVPTTTPFPTLTPPPISNGGGNGYLIPVFNTPTDGFTVTVESVVPNTNPAQVNLRLNGGTATRMALSNTSDFAGVGQQAYNPTALWTLTAQDGPKTVYVKFYDAFGTASPVVHTTVVITGASEVVTLPGVVGEVLGEKITRLDELLAMLKFGQTKNEIRELQTELKKLGYFSKTFKPTKYYGWMTRSAVQKYLAKKNKQLGETKNLDELLSILKFGQRNELVRQLQTELKTLKFFPTNQTVTNYYGAITRGAKNKYLASK